MFSLRTIGILGVILTLVLAAGQTLRESRHGIERVVALLTLLLGSVILICPIYAVFTGGYPSIFLIQDLVVWILILGSLLGLSLGWYYASLRGLPSYFVLAVTLWFSLGLILVF